MDIRELDGTYRVTTVSDYQGPIEKKSDGVTTVTDGKTHRVDDAGCVWTTEMRFITENEVEFISVADPADAAPDFCLTTENGNLTREPVTYKTRLRVDRKGDKVKISGQIHHGKTTTLITMIR